MCSFQKLGCEGKMDRKDLPDRGQRRCLPKVTDQRMFGGEKASREIKDVREGGSEREQMRREVRA